MATSTDSEIDMAAVSARAPMAHRYFFALLPDQVTARRIHAFAEREFGAKGLVRTDRLHVTLAITADLDASYPVLVDALRRAGDAVSTAPFDVAFDQLSGGRRTVALRPVRNASPLRALQAALARAMAAQGIPMRADWSFSPHVTLVYRDGEPITRPVEGFAWSAREFVLIESLVGLTQHNVLGRWTLSAPQPSLFPD
jgi:2'-5' RNA ligase